MSKMKRAILGLLVLILSLALNAGCGGDKKPAAPAGGAPAAGATVAGKVMLYSSMKDSQLAALKAGFMKKNPGIQMDYYTAGTGSVMTKLATEQQAGGISADLLWVGEPTNYREFKAKGLLMPYKSAEAAQVPDQFKDKDDMFIAARVVSLGFVYNKSLVKPEDVPKTWEDLLKPRFKGLVGMTDPTFSGTTLFTVAGLVQNPNYGWKYLEQLKANGVKLERGSGGVVNKVGSGDYHVSIGVDYIAWSLMKQGSPIGFVYPVKDIPIIDSPIAIVKNTKNEKAAKLLYDYILSEEGQKILMVEFTAPVRKGLQLEGAIPIAEAVQKKLPVNEDQLSKGKNDMLKKFDSIFKAK